MDSEPINYESSLKNTETDQQRKSEIGMKLGANTWGW